MSDDLAIEEVLTRSFPRYRAHIAARLDLPALDVWDEDLKNHTFRLSLASAAHLLAGVNGWRNLHGIALSVLPGYVDKMMPNAFADRDGEVHLVGMMTPLFVAVQEFAMYCFTQRDFFGDVGNPAAEHSPPAPEGGVPGLWLLRYTRTGGTVGPEHSPAMTPRDDERYAASLYLGFLMARFVWFHEYAHCYNGHVAYVQEKKIALQLNEVAEPLAVASSGRRSLRDLRCLELDADEAALWASWQVQATDRENLESFASFHRDLRKRMTLFGAYAMTWLFEEFQNDMQARAGITHPTPYLRLHNMLDLAAGRLSSQGDARLCESVWGEFDHIASSIPNMYGSAKLKRGLPEPAIERELHALRRRLDALRPDLAHHRYAPSTP